MEIRFIFQAYYYTHYHGAIAKAEHVGDELSKHLSNRNYVTDIELEELNFEFINMIIRNSPFRYIICAQT